LALRRGRGAFAAPAVPWLLAGHALVSLAGLVAQNFTFTIVQGRYLLASLPPCAILLAAGLARWAGPLRRAGVRRADAAVDGAVFVLLLAMNVAGVAAVWRAYGAG
jgi:hypothetical protein